MDLPPELLRLICSFLPKFDLKVIRLVCHQFDKLAVPFLYDRVVISANCADLGVSRLVGQRFGAFVKELIYDTRIYADLDRQQHDEEVFLTIALMDPPKGPLAQPTLHELDSSYAEYRIQRRDQDDLTRAGELALHLYRAFTMMPNIETVVISDASEWLDKEWLRRRMAWSLCSAQLHRAPLPKEMARCSTSKDIASSESSSSCPVQQLKRAERESVRSVPRGRAHALNGQPPA